MTLNGLGPICYPPLITALLIAFGVQGCVLLLGIIGAHTLVAALLLQPVKRHLTDVTTDGDICQELESQPIRMYISCVRVEIEIYIQLKCTT